MIVRESADTLCSPGTYFGPGTCDNSKEIGGYSSPDAHAFGVDRTKGRMKVSQATKSHTHMDKEYEQEFGYDDDLDNAYEGRLWKNHKIISFWEYPNPEHLGRIIKAIEAELLAKEGIKLDMWDDPEWRIEVMISPIDGKPSYKSKMSPIIPIQYTTILQKFKDYGGSGDIAKIDHHKPPSEREKKEVPAHVGSKRYGEKKPLAWRQALVPESLNEFSDVIDYEDQEISLTHSDKGAYPFGFYDGEAIIGNEGSSHENLARDLKNKHPELKYKLGKKSLDFFLHPGRVWAKEQILSYWNYPESKEELMKELDLLQVKLWEAGVDIQPFNSGQWRIEIRESKGKKLISLNDFVDSKDASPQEKSQDHLAPSIHKEVSYGFGSKHPKAAERNAWRMGKPFESLVPESLEESLNFKRGEKPLKSMNIGTHRKEKDTLNITCPNCQSNGFYPIKKARESLQKKHNRITHLFTCPYCRMNFQATLKLKESLSFERGADPMKAMGLGLEARIQKIKDEIEWKIEDDQWQGPGMLSFNGYSLDEIWEHGEELDKIAITKILEEYLSGKKKWRKNRTRVLELIKKAGLIWDPQYMVPTPNNAEDLGQMYPEEFREFAIKYFKPNQIYSSGIRLSDPELMKEGIKKGATNLSIGGTDVFQIPLKNDDGELLKLLLSKSDVDPGEMFTVRTGDYYGRSERTERDESNKALRMAARDGKINTFRVLFNDSRSDPSATNNFALKWAIKGGYNEIIDLLLSDERVQKKLHLLPNNAQAKLREWDLLESVQFERGKDPKEAMGIGKEALKVFRCGHCGQPTDEYGRPLEFESPEFNKAIDIIDKMKDKTTELTDCDACMDEFEREGRQREEEYERQAEAQSEWEQSQRDAEEDYYITH